MSTNEFIATQDGRIDKVLANHLEVSRNQIEKLIDNECVSVGQKVVTKSSQKVLIGDMITYTLPEATKKEAVEVDFDVEVIYEDEHLLVINKPSGLVVHPAPSVKEPTLVDWLIARGVSLSTVSGEERHGIVHRIDKDTTGALVVAKSNEAHEKLSSQLEDKTMGRIYIALIDYPLKDNCIVEQPIARSPHNRLKMGIVDGGKYAKSAFGKLISNEKIELIAAKLFTGRTHQIRVHLASLNRHILGDKLYGYIGRDMPRVFLHAKILYFTHPITNQYMEFVAPLYDDMKNYLADSFGESSFETIEKDYLKEIFNATY